MDIEELDNLALENYRNYLRIPSVHPNPDLGECVTFLQDQAASLGLPVKVFELVADKPIVLITWIGLEPHLPSVLLNGHMDVVPVFREKWNRDPFAAEMDENGNIYARGTQDMKGVSIQYLEAIRRLKLSGTRLKRTIHVSFMPDEEVGGVEGMNLFVKSDQFKLLNVGFGMDEGRASPENFFLVRYVEKCRWTVKFHCQGQSGHGSLLIKNSPGEKAIILLAKLYKFRSEQQEKLDRDPLLSIGDVISLNMTVISGGIQANVVPDEITFVVDFRIPNSINVQDFETTLNSWCKESGEGVYMEFVSRTPQIPATKIDNSNPFWMAFSKAADDLKIDIKPRVLSGITDSRYLRELGIPALGFSPMNNTLDLPHDHNEYLNKDIFLRGVQIFVKIISEVANVEG